MRARLLGISVAAWLAGGVVACGGSSSRPAASMTIIAPNGGEVWTIGLTATVTWSSAEFEGDVDLDVSTDAGATWTPWVVGTADDGLEVVTVPATPSPTARVRVRASGGDPAAPRLPWDASDADFRIGGAPTDLEAGLPGVVRGALAWGDYDGDGDLDLALAGDSDAGVLSRIYRRDAGAFTDVGAPLPGVHYAALAWGDYDNDGDLDLALAGDTRSGLVTRIYRNEDGIFTDLGAGLPGVLECSLAWGDYDNDGDLDLALGGWDGLRAITQIRRNDGGTFVDAGAGLRGAFDGWLAWGDADADGDLDLAVAGFDFVGVMCRVYRNDDGTFTDLLADLPGFYHGGLAWGDYDDDGDLDLAVAGFDGAQLFTRVVRNDDGVYVDVAAGLPGVLDGALAWGDYDNDGDLDLALAGRDPTGVVISQILRNDEGTFVDVVAGLPGVVDSALGWGDVDGDGDLDLALAGHTGTASGLVSRVYRNDGGFAPDTPPSAPTDIRAFAGAGVVVITWLPAEDLETPTSGLSYNLRVGRTPTDGDAYPSMADGAGVRTIPARGPIAPNPDFCAAWLVLPAGTYYVRVQAVDPGFEGGPWSPPLEVVVP